jgi:branched-chain amino acid transport system ATP-binding protein
MTAMVAQEPTKPLLRISGVGVRLGGLQILDDVSVDVVSGQRVGLIGPNGAGKTSLFNVICGFLRTDRGSLDWDGRPLRRHRPHDLTRMGVARTLQGLGLFEHQTALDNVMVGAAGQARTSLPAALLGFPRNDRTMARVRSDAMSRLDALGIADVAHRPCASLPYGTRKRVALARALISRPRLLLLDEPAAGLSGDEIAQLGNLLRALPEGPAVMLVEHHMDLVMSVCDQVYVLDFGKVIAAGAPDQVRGNPAVQQAYLGEAAVVTAAEPA